MKHLALTAALTASCASAALAQQAPRAFVIGEDTERAYELLGEQQQVGLLEACDCSMEKAFKLWVGMLHEIEKYAEREEMDIRGVKVWLHAFYDDDGSVEHLAYHLRPSSKQVDEKAFTHLLKGFAKQYTFPVLHEGGFAHYSTGSFPIFGDVTARTGN